MTGADLRALRKTAGLTQAQLAALSEVSRDCVQYWEGKALVDLRGYGPRRMLGAIGNTRTPAALEALQRLSDCQRYTRARARAVSTVSPGDLHARLAADLGHQAQRAAKRRVTCGAKTRIGTPCRMKSEPGKRRCKFHGGKSTGVRTPEGRERIRQAQLRRWAKWRADRQQEAKRRC